jgi:predicted short-subunit dehydrogenase-like oxidoreductase (DUF2520 family)
MRELERDTSEDPSCCSTIAVVGRGRLGTALASALTANGYRVLGPLGRDALGRDALGRDADLAAAEAVLLCVPDEEIAAAAAGVPAGRLVGHCSGATGLEPLAPHEAFSLHPLMTVTAAGAAFSGAGAAVDGSTPRALRFARELACGLGMEPVRIAPEDRPLYHAAASVASNFLITLEAAAERLAAEVGLERRLLVPLVRATVENWATMGGRRALTGPVARGDDATVTRQRDALERRAPELLELFDALVAATQSIAADSQQVVA